MNLFREKPSKKFNAIVDSIGILLAKPHVQNSAYIENITDEFYKAMKYYDALSKNKTVVIKFKDKQAPIYASLVNSYNAVAERQMFVDESQAVQNLWFIDFFIVVENLYHWWNNHRYIFTNDNLTENID